MFSKIWKCEHTIVPAGGIIQGSLNLYHKTQLYKDVYIILICHTSTHIKQNEFTRWWFCL